MDWERRFGDIAKEALAFHSAVRGAWLLKLDLRV
jgi:hypothetical protein